MQGQSLLPLFKGETAKWRTSLYYAYYEYGEHKVPRHFGVRTATQKLMYFPDTDEWNMFDLPNDPNEMRSIYGDESSQAVQKELTNEFNRLRVLYDAPDFAG